MISADLLSRYGTAPVPRYTSYPPANVWGVADEAFAAQALRNAAGRPLSLYVHVPFCKKLCFYCGCNMLVTRRPELVERYLGALEREIELTAEALASPGRVLQLHLGGGTPTYLTEAQLTRVFSALARRFSFEPGFEASIEVHPPVTTESQLRTLKDLGFNRLSMGVQDFDPEVQQRVNRPQPFEQTKGLIEAARRLGFTSVNVDLMYGLPLQTAERFDRTLDRVLELRPDRIALFGYAHMPSLKKHQRLIRSEELPGASERLRILVRSIERLTGAGYASIGLDHFALRTDELFKARQDGTLRRNFMGYTTCAESEVVAFGPSSISEVGGAFVQSEREVHAWAERLETGHLATVRGWRLSADDSERGAIISRLFCQLEARVPGELEARELAALEADGLVRRDGEMIKVTEDGQLLLRNVAVVFDKYYRMAKGERLHSPAV